MPSVLISGANRGLGLEFTRQFVNKGWQVFACCRNPDKAEELKAMADNIGEKLSLHNLDVSDHDQIESLSRTLKDHSIDVLLNNAGVFGSAGNHLGEIDYQDWIRTLEINTLSPFKMAECFLPQICRSDKKQIVSITSRMGSITDNDSGAYYAYRSSKSALNMAMHSLSIDLKDRGVTVVVLHPGWVKTDMGGSNALITPEESVTSMVKTIEGLTPGNSGKFFDRDGAELPW